MDGNTSTSTTVEAISSAIDLIPGALLIVDADGVLEQYNDAAERLLRIGLDNASLRDLVDNGDEVLQTLRNARRTSATLPLALRRSGRGGRISASVRPIGGGPGAAPTHLLVNCQREEGAAYKMRMLTERLERSVRRQRVLREQNRKLRRTVERTLPKLREATLRDPLTGAFNRRYFDRQLKREWQRALRQDAPVSLIYIDVDHFKAYNDAFGHHRGDHCLRAVADALRNAVTREFDCVCRVGGEEFALLLPMTDAAGALNLARRALAAIRAKGLRHPANVVGIVTASLGVGTCEPRAGDDPESFVAAVDGAMYRAKKRGRNRVCCLPGPWHGDGSQPAAAGA